MSEYVRKQALLDRLDELIGYFGGNSFLARALKRTMEEIQSGAFDAPEMEHINAYWAREGLIKHQEAEVQRLRAALERIRKITKESREAKYVDNYLLIEMVAEQALSTTTEPTDAAKVERFECPCCGCEISINAPEGDGNA